jgi:hypothetical protein
MDGLMNGLMNGLIDSARGRGARQLELRTFGAPPEYADAARSPPGSAGSLQVRVPQELQEH